MAQETQNKPENKINPPNTRKQLTKQASTHSLSENTIPVYGSDNEKSNMAPTNIIDNKTQKESPQPCRPEESMREYLDTIIKN